MPRPPAKGMVPPPVVAATVLVAPSRPAVAPPSPTPRAAGGVPAQSTVGNAAVAAGLAGAAPDAVRPPPALGNAATAAALSAIPPPPLTLPATGPPLPGAPVPPLALTPPTTAPHPPVEPALPAAGAAPPAPVVGVSPAPALPAAGAAPLAPVVGVSPAPAFPAAGAGPAAAPAPTVGPEAAPAKPEKAAAGPEVARAGGPDAVAAPEKAAAKRRSPGSDPKFQALAKDVARKKKAVTSSHPPAKAEAGAAQAAAVPPPDDREARGKAAHAEEMNEAQPKVFDRAEFVRAVEEAIAKRTPQNLKEADEFGTSGKTEEAKAEVQGKVGEGKRASAEEIATTTAAQPRPAPDAKDVVPMTPDRPPSAPGTPQPANAIPDRLPPAATDMSAGPEQVEARMAAADVTEPQLARSNEPRFKQALAEKEKLDAHSAAAPPALRAEEAAVLGGAEGDARRLGGGAMSSMAGTRAATGRTVQAGMGGAKKRDEDKRARVTAILQSVFDATRTDVEKILSDLDGKVDRQFTAGEKAAREQFTREHGADMRRWKDERYSGPFGWTMWLRDWALPLPDEVNRFYENARRNYINRMRGVISDVATTIEVELRRAKDRIAAGRTQLQDAVRKLPADLRAIGQEAAGEFAEKFTELADTVDEKGTELVDTLATKYTEAVKSVDDEIAREKEKNRGALAKAVDAVKGVIDAIIELKNMLLGVLRKAAQALRAILADPIGFLGRLISAVGGGLKLFMRNIGRHMAAGILGWLLGTAPQAGLRLPAQFDARGIVLLISTLLGLTWSNIRGRIVRRVPEPAVAAAETALPIVGKVKRQGVGGMWDDIKGRVGDLKKELISKIIAYLVPTVIIAGVTWILSLLNPASAFIRACKMIIDIVRFIVTQGRQIIEFVNVVLDAVIAIARGGGGGVPQLVERALARSIPVLIGALAAILGIGGIAGKVKQIFQTLSRPVNRAVDWVIGKIVDLVKKLWAKLKPKRRPDKRPRRDRPGLPRVPRAPRRRRPPRASRPPRAKRPDDRRDRRRPDQREQRRALAAALREARALVRPGASIQEIRAELPEIRHRHRLTSLRLVVDGVTATSTFLHFEAVVNPSEQSPRDEIRLTHQEIQETYGILAAHQDRFQRFADQRGLVIDIRATNPYSAPWIEQGAIPKPTKVKAKTIKPEDTLIGVQEWKLGLVGFFEPTRPVPGSRNFDAANERFNERTKEYAKYYNAMQDLRPPPETRGYYVVEDQVVWGFTDQGEKRRLAGDNDLFQIRYIKDESLLEGKPYVKLLNRMMAANIGVAHGATVNWSPPADLVEIKIEVIRKAADEKIIRFRPHLPPRLVTSTTPIEAVDRAR
ncbi:phage tail protein [Phytohabitans sp. LJ34]|uniref:phage tail protein n=1 Tax=Phytohabitans sp. LJ34 TaxID=3452217 RepID=UPI003F89D03B